MLTEVIGWVFLVLIVVAIIVTIIFVKKRNTKFNEDAVSRNVNSGDKNEVLSTDSKATFNAYISREKRKSKKMQKAIDKRNKAIFKIAAAEWKQKADIIKQELTDKCKFNNVNDWSTLDGFINSLSVKCPHCGSSLERTGYEKLSYGGAMDDVTYTRRESTGLYVGFTPVMQNVTYKQKALVGAMHDNFRTRYIKCNNCKIQVFTQQGTNDKVEIRLWDIHTESGEDKVRTVFRPSILHNKFNLFWRTPVLEKELSQELKNYLDEPLILPE